MIQIDQDRWDTRTGSDDDSAHYKRGGGCCADLWDASLGGWVVCNTIASGKSGRGARLSEKDLAGDIDHAGLVGRDTALRFHDTDHVVGQLNYVTANPSGSTVGKQTGV